MTIGLPTPLRKNPKCDLPEQTDKAWPFPSRQCDNNDAIRGTCINQGRPFSDLTEAWAACGAQPGCEYVTRKWGLPRSASQVAEVAAQYYLYRETDPIAPAQVQGWRRYPKACVAGNNIGLHLEQSESECAARCDADPSCTAFEYGVAYGGITGNYQPGDCNLQSSADRSGCDGT